MFKLNVFRGATVMNKMSLCVTTLHKTGVLKGPVR